MRINPTALLRATLVTMSPGLGNLDAHSRPTGVDVPSTNSRDASHEKARPEQPGTQKRAGKLWMATEEQSLVRTVEQQQRDNPLSSKISWAAVATEHAANYPGRTKAAVYAKYRTIVAGKRPPETLGEAQASHGSVPELDSNSLAMLEPAKGDGDMEETEVAVGNIGETVTVVNSQSTRIMAQKFHNNIVETDLAQSCHNNIVAKDITQPTHNGIVGDSETGDKVEETEDTKVFLGHLAHALTGFSRAPLRKPAKVIKPLLARCDRLIAKYMLPTKAKAGAKPSFGRVNALVYAAGRTYNELYKAENSASDALGKERIEKVNAEVLSLRKSIGKIHAELTRRRKHAKPTPRQSANLVEIYFQYKVRSVPELTSCLNILKDRLRLIKNKVAVNEAALRRRQARQDYARSPGARYFNRSERGGGDCPSPGAVRRYWKGILGGGRQFAATGSVARWGQLCGETYGALGGVKVSKEECLGSYRRAICKARPFKAPGPDGIQGFWWKAFATATTALGQQLTEVIAGTRTRNPPNWFARGRTVLLFKDGDQKNPANYRPITCLNVAYKVLTAMLAQQVRQHLDKGKLAIPSEQRALKTGEWGCAHAHLIDSAIVDDTMKGSRQRPLAVAWVDYAKAFDSIPHAYLMWVLRQVNVPVRLREVISSLIGKWETRFELWNGGKKVSTDLVKVRNGLLQGDSLSPLLFCLSVAPITFALNEKIPPVATTGGHLKVNHQFYVDDLKVYARSEEKLNLALEIVEETSSSLGLKMNARKSAKAFYRIRPSPDARMQDRECGRLPVLGSPSTYKYLGIEQLISREPSVALKRVREKFLKRAELIFSSELTIGQMVNAYNCIAVPVVRYCYQNTAGGSRKFSGAMKEARKLDGAVRSVMTRCKARFKSQSVADTYLPRSEGGVGLKSLETTLKEVILGNFAYLVTQGDQNIEGAQKVLASLGTRGKRTPITDAQKVLEGLSCQAMVHQEERQVSFQGELYGNTRALLRKLTSLVRSEDLQRMRTRFRELTTAGRVARGNHLDWQRSCLWIAKGCVSAVNERNVRGIMQGCIIQPGDRLKTCRSCKGTKETEQHIVSSCVGWLSTLYVERHDSVLRNLHYVVCRQYGLPTTHYSQCVAPVLENDQAKVLWNQPIQTVQPMTHNRPDIVVHDKKRKNIVVIEGRVSWYTAMQLQQQIKAQKYTVNSTRQDDYTSVPYPSGPNLVGDLRSQHRQQVKFLPVIIGCNGEVPSTLAQDLRETLNLKDVDQLIERMSRSAALGTSRVIKAHLALDAVNESQPTSEA